MSSQPARIAISNAVDLRVQADGGNTAERSKGRLVMILTERLDRAKVKLAEVVPAAAEAPPRGHREAHLR